MQIIITSRQMELSPRIRQYIERKVQRLSRLVDADTRIDVVVSEEKTRSARDHYSVQLSLAHGSHPIRSEVSAVNVNAAFDGALYKITVQLGRHKDRQKSTLKHGTRTMKVLSLSRSGQLATLEDEQETAGERYDGHAAVKVAAPTISEESNEEIWSQVMEIRRVQTKPMNDQEAIAQMEALGMTFYPFFNEATKSVNVMYRLDTGGYGLLVPDLE